MHTSTQHLALQKIMHKSVCTRSYYIAELQSFLLASPHFQEFLFLPLSAPVHVLGFSKKVQSSEGIELNYVARHIPSVFTAPNCFQLSALQKLQKVHHAYAYSMELVSAEEHSKCVFQVHN